MDKLLERYGLSRAKYYIYCLFAWTIIGAFLWYKEEDKSIYKIINGSHSGFLDWFFPMITYTGTFYFIILVLMMLFIIPKYRNKFFIITMAVSQIVPILIVQLIKNIVQAPRPMRYFQGEDWIHFVADQPLNYSLSFPSGHTAGIFALCSFVAICLSRKLQVLGILLFIFALISGISRIYLSQHFYADVYVGSLISSYMVLLCYAVFYKYTPLGHQIDFKR